MSTANWCLTISFIHTYDFTDEQMVILKKIKEIFTSNVASRRDLTASDVFGNLFMNDWSVHMQSLILFFKENLTRFWMN